MYVSLEEDDNEDDDDEDVDVDDRSMRFELID